MAPKPTTAERRATLLRDPDVRVWYKDRAKPSTATTQLDQLELFLRRTGISARELVSLGKNGPKKLKETVNEYVRAEQNAGRKAKYILNVWWGVRSFLKFAEAAPEWNPKVEKTAADEDETARTVPTTDELRQIANAVMSSRDRAVVYLLASSGVRIGVLAAQHDPTDGLRLKHLPDLKLVPEPRFEKVPFAIRVPAFLSKGKNAYYTFGSHEAADAVLAMLKERARGGEELSPDSPLVIPSTRGRSSERVSKDGQPFMIRKALAERVKLAMVRVAPAGAEWSAHTLRAWFSTQMESCESKGLISRTRREFFMGHTLGVDGDYNLDRPLPPAKIDELRQSYARCEPHLSTGSSPAESRIDVLTDLFAALAKDRGMKDDQIQDALSGRLSKEELERIIGSRKAKPVERLVPKDRLSALSLQGWEFVSPLGSDQAVIRWTRSAALGVSGDGSPAFTETSTREGCELR